jgi:secreted trypsin-like serine protease
LVCSVKDQWYVVGLVAWGLSCGGSIPAVYTNVSRYINWIQNVTIAP